MYIDTHHIQTDKNTTKMLDGLFRLPVEVFSHIVAQLTDDDLARLFELEKLVLNRENDGAYTQIRKIALQARFLGKRLVITNGTFPSKHLVGANRQELLPLRVLAYFMHERLVIKPRDITFSLLDFASIDTYNYVFEFTRLFLPYVTTFTDNFNFHLVASEHSARNRDTFMALVNAFAFLNVKIKNFSLTFEGKSCTCENSFNIGTDYLNKLCIEHLKLNTFNSNWVLDHFMSYLHTSHYGCNGLNSLDLSYNAVDDEKLSLLKLPKTLQSLNLSNNNLTVVSNRNLNFTELVYLNKLDLSNNNIISIDVRSEGPSNLLSLNLSCNNITSCSFLHSRYFDNLRSLDVSRNLLTKVSSIPPRIELLSLCGNYLHSLLDNIDGFTFPISLVRLNLSWCKIRRSQDDLHINEVISHLINTENLHNLKFIEIDTIYSPLPKEYTR